MNMDTPDIKQEILDTDSPESDTTFQWELTEYGNPVPFKIIKEKQDKEPAIPSVAPSEPPVWIGNPGPSNVDHSGTSFPSHIASEPSKKRVETTSFQPSKRIYHLENELSSDAYSSDGDIADKDNIDNSDTDSEYEYLSDSDYPFQSKNGAGPDILKDADVDKNSQDRPPTPEWTFDSSCMLQLKFTKTQELRVTPPQTPYEAFRLFLNDELLNTLVQETNKYAACICKKPSLRLKSRFKSWTDVTREEMIRFLALLIHTGTIRTTRLRDYWKQDYLFNLTCFSRFMNKNRFLLILNCLNFGPPPSFLTQEAERRGHISKIQHVINNFNTNMSKIYYPGKELIFTKSIVCWRGQMVRQEYIDHRRQKDGINVYMLAEPNGTVMKLQVYGNQKSLKVKNGEIIKELLEHYQGNGHAIYLDKRYSSWKLATNLLDSQTYCTGTLSKNSTDNLFGTVCELPKQSHQSFFRKGVHIGKWVDNTKSVLYISTEFDDQLQKVVQKNGVVSAKPKALINYSKYMTASGLQHQLMSCYPCSSKSLRWYKKLFIHFLQIYLSNAHHLFNNYSGYKKLVYFDFRLALLRAILPELEDAPPKTLQLSHALTKITKMRHRYRTDNDGKRVRKVNEVVRRDCKMCRRMKRRRVTQFECLGCTGSPAFCTSCFCEFHSTQMVTN